jgi:2-C-methyl-D-erythritol 4-phosphate cytidylyltransferase
VVKKQTFWCVVPAAGRGTRVGGDVPKQYLPVAGRPLIEHTLSRLDAHPLIAGLVVVLAADDPHWAGVAHRWSKELMVTTGGAERCDSVLAGIRALPIEEVRADDFVLVHDAARPCVREADITSLIDQVTKTDGGILGAPLRDTLKRVDEEGRSHVTEPRDHRWRAFTPQMFRREPLCIALAAARDAGVTVSDEAMAMERAGFSPLLVEGAEDNIKVTTATDFALAEFLLSRMK